MPNSVGQNLEDQGLYIVTGHMKSHASFRNLRGLYLIFLLAIPFELAQASSPVPVAATALEFKISGVFDGVGEVDANPYFSGNKLEALVGTKYSSSFIVGTDVSSTQYMNIGPEGNSAWLFKSGYTNSLSNLGFSYANRPIVVATVHNDFHSDGAIGSLPAGVYDSVEFTGWLYDTGSGHIFGSQPGVAGFNVEQNFELIGTSDMLSDQNKFPFGSLDLGKVVYGQYYLTLYYDGVVVGRVEQDPPLYFDNGVLSGPGMSVAVAAVPEPSTLLLLALGSPFIFLRGRRRG